MKNELKCTLLITTYNRKDELRQTLRQIDNVKTIDKIVICDDGSTDGTNAFIREKYPHIDLIEHHKPHGLIASRNQLMDLVDTPYAISLDDDANFLTSHIIDNIIDLFQKQPRCAVQAFRIYWGTDKPVSIDSAAPVEQVQGFVGCGHAWRMDAWNEIKPYPEWFEFYGEEQYAALKLYKLDWEIWYNPSILVHHRVDLKQRKANTNQYYSRLRKGIRAGWYLYAMFYPMPIAVKKIARSFYSKLKNFVIKGDLKMAWTLILVIKDFFRYLFKFMNATRLTMQEYRDYEKLPEAKIYWHLENTDP
jgi:GT2 family glycosyltransferase